MNLSEKDVRQRGITRLCHFTKSNKLLHIMSSESGIISVKFLAELHGDLLAQNDTRRYDGKLDHISCSVQYPNTWYLNKIRDIDPIFKQWVVLFLNPMIMLDSRTLFCHRNAAANSGRDLKNGLKGFEGMFKQTVQGQRLLTRTRQMPDCCPTDGQAEVMIYRHIARSDILAVAVPTIDQAKDEIVRLEFIASSPEVQFVIAPDLFNNNWHSQIRVGKIPEEMPYDRGE